MWDVHSKEFSDRINELLPDAPLVMTDRKTGACYSEIYADYRDELGADNIKKIMESDDPEAELWDIVIDGFGEAEGQIRWDTACWLAEHLNDEQDDDSVDPNDVLDYLYDDLDIRYPDLSGETVPVTIFMDTGDANYDFSLNNPIRSYWGQGQTTFDEDSSLLWLVRQQGHKKSEIVKALKADGYPENKFLRSVVEEVENAGNCMNALVFLVEMPLRTWFKLRRAQKQEEAGEVRYYPRKSRGRGYIVLDKNTTCGLFNEWIGGGSILNIALEKDVKIPLRYIWRAHADYCHSYSVADVYGLCYSAWHDTLKEIHPMKKKLEKKEKKDDAVRAG
jgi:hypothetical protein